MDDNNINKLNGGSINPNVNVPNNLDNSGSVSNISNFSTTNNNENVNLEENTQEVSTLQNQNNAIPNNTNNNVNNQNINNGEFVNNVGNANLGENKEVTPQNSNVMNNQNNINPNVTEEVNTSQNANGYGMNNSQNNMNANSNYINTNNMTNVNNQNMAYPYNNQYNNQYNNFPNGQPMPNNTMGYYNQTHRKNKSSRGLKIAIFICILLLICIGALFFIPFLKDSSSSGKMNRTIMMYMVGSNLESEGAMATADLKDIKPENIDLENIDFVLMVGGSTKWHNYVEEDEVAIYHLTESGFEKEKVYKLSSMGTANSLSKFLNYAYENYPAKNYDLIFWNHGLGVAGLEQDEIYNEYININDLENALKNSPFNEKNKMESVIFVTCLSGNIHFAGIMSKYADYMVASEENMYVSPYLDKFNVIEQIEVDDDGKDIGIKFIKNFEKSNEYFYSMTKQKLDGTFSVIDLSKIETLSKKVDNYLSSLDLEDDYRSIARVRSTVKTYGQDFKGYDTVDLYTLVNSMGSLASSSKKKELLDALEDTIVYNWSVNNYSHGIAIYFPYYGSAEYLNMHFKLLKNVSSTKYYNFIKDFNDLRTNRASFDTSLEEIESSANIQEFNVKLPDDKIENFANSSVLIYKLMDDSTYLPVYTSSEVTLIENGRLSFTNTGKVLKITNNEYGTYDCIYLIEKEKTNDYTQYMTYAKLTDKDGNSVNAIIYINFNEENSNVNIDKVTKYNEGLPTMALLELDNYTSIEFLNSKYNIIDENGEYYDDWYDEGVSTSFEVPTNNYSFELIDVQPNGEYFAVFKVSDIYNNNYYSKLIQIQ